MGVGGREERCCKKRRSWVRDVSIRKTIARRERGSEIDSKSEKEKKDVGRGIGVGKSERENEKRKKVRAIDAKQLSFRSALMRKKTRG